MKIYTKTGDKGETGLFGGERVSKNSLRLNAYGTLDELNAFVGLVLVEVKNEEVKKVLLDVQNKLFTVGTDLATPQTEKNEKLKITRTPQSFIVSVEKTIDAFEDRLDKLNNFILPGGSITSAHLHVCRTIARRAEREIVALKSTVNIGDNILIFINRLSDLFFVLSRFENKVSNVSDIIWNSKS